MVAAGETPASAAAVTADARAFYGTFHPELEAGADGALPAGGLPARSSNVRRRRACSVVFALAVAAVVGVAALSAGEWAGTTATEKRRMQTAVDAAAQDGAEERPRLKDLYVPMVVSSEKDNPDFWVRFGCPAINVPVVSAWRGRSSAKVSSRCTRSPQCSPR